MTVIAFPNKKTGCCGSKTTEWLTLPVAPHAAARSRFCGNEKLPQAVPLPGALTWIDDLIKTGRSIAGLDINGPGDPLATLSLTLEILNLLHEKHPEFSLGITTLGLGLAEHADQLKKAGVSRITLLVDAINPETAQNLYAWVRPGKKNMPMARAAVTLTDDQSKGILACHSAGMEVAVHTTVYRNVNEQEVEEIARRVSGLGAESLILLPGKGWSENEEKLPLPAPETMEQLGEAAARHIKIVEPSESADLSEISDLPEGGSIALPKPTADRPNVAALSSNGMDIDLHLGQAIKALIYGPRGEDGLACLLEARDLPEPGGGNKRWEQVAETLDDCFVLLAESAGQKPREILGRHGLTLLLIDDNVEGTVDVLYGGGKKGKAGKNRN